MLFITLDIACRSGFFSNLQYSKQTEYYYLNYQYLPEKEKTVNNHEWNNNRDLNQLDLRVF
jgi:hypothetical protein